MSILRELRAFLFRGNIVELAVAFVIGVAFVAVVNALVADLITPIVAAIVGKPDFGGLSFTINDSHFRYGDFINAAITFVAVAAAVFFSVVKPMELVTSRMKKDEKPTTREMSGVPERDPRRGAALLELHDGGRTGRVVTRRERARASESRARRPPARGTPNRRPHALPCARRRPIPTSRPPRRG